MDIVGALSKSHTNSIVYFCEYNEEECEKIKVSEISTIPKENISMVIIDSKDEMTDDMHLVGVVDKTGKGIYAESYDYLDIYVKQLCEREDTYDTITA